ncbi:XPA protein C-terminus-domain-containing protein, partial [Chytriomyces sp. MP71]
EYCEFNLSTMHDTRGGFIVDDSATDDLATVQQQHQSNHQQDQQGANDFTRAPVSTLPPDALCREQTCKSIDIHPDYHKHYAVLVCRKCAQDPDKASAYALLTKTECREDYLLTESELRDTARLPHWMKKNPHKDTYANMLLYLRAQVEAFAIEKWGSLEKLDEEFARREETKGQRKKKKFETKLVELRKKTLTSTWRRVEKVHVHEFGDKVGKGGGMFEQTCETCGL